MIIKSTVSPALKISLQFIGVWPDVSYFTFCWLIFMSNMLLIQYFQYLYVLEHFNISEVVDLSDSLPVALVYSLQLLRLTSLWIHRRVFHKILAAMDNDWYDCINIDQHLNIMTVKASVSHFYCNAMFIFYGFSAIIYFMGDYGIRFLQSANDYNTNNNNTNTLRQLPIKMLLPFKTEQSPIFELLVIILFLDVLLCSLAIALLNGVILTLVLHVSGQIDIICQEFRNISENVFPSQAFAITLGMLVERHNKVYTFSENIEKLVSFDALMQIVWKSLIMCCLGFVIIISVQNGEHVFVIVKAALGYVVLIGEMFITCFAGEYLSLKNKSVTDAAYESSWYDMSPNQGKIISFMIMRSQKRLSITAGKMMDMSFEALSNFVKASASYVSVLFAMYYRQNARYQENNAVQ